MVERYTFPDMAAVFEPEAKLRRWLEVELLVIEGWSKVGRIPPAVPARVRRAAPSIDAAFVAAVDEREAEVRHDVAAFVDVVAGGLGDDGRWFHYGITSSDVVDTANAVALRAAADLVIGGGLDLFDALATAAARHRGTVMIGRTHGVHAEPISLAAKLALLALQVSRAMESVSVASEALRVGMVSGAVGSYTTVPPDVEVHVCESLGLQPIPAAQFIPRDLHAQFAFALARATAAVEALALQVRLGHQTEVGEVMEGFAESQKGSSAMPHKRNPITAEQLCGLARLARAYVGPVLEDVALWHEHDISHSSVERVVLRDICSIAHYALQTAARLVRGLVVDEGRIAANLASAGDHVSSQALLLRLVDAGWKRDEAYRLVQEAVDRSRGEQADFENELRRLDPSIPGTIFEAAAPRTNAGAAETAVDALGLCWAARRSPLAAGTLAQIAPTIPRDAPEVQ
jgi:adenylosuccinate lyase